MPINHKLLRPKTAGGYVASDADARAYIAAVELADGDALERAVKEAIDNFVVGCKADGIWSAIQACCILCGARTLSGALTPLVGSAPTNNGPFVSGDYTRGGATPGLLGNGSTKYIDTGRADNADGKDDCHRAVWVSALASNAFATYFGARPADYSTMTELYRYPFSGNSEIARCRSTGGRSITSAEAAGLKGVSRSSSASFSIRTNGESLTETETSAAATTSRTVLIFRTYPGDYGNQRTAFYSVGSALTLTTLESRVSTLITAIGAAV